MSQKVAQIASAMWSLACCRSHSNVCFKNSYIAVTHKSYGSLDRENCPLQRWLCRCSFGLRFSDPENFVEVVTVLSEVAEIVVAVALVFGEKFLRLRPIHIEHSRHIAP